MDWSLKSRRKLWLQVHLYLGLSAGAVFVLIGLTGSLLVFEQPLDEWLNAGLMRAEPSEGHNRLLSLDEIVKAGLQAMPAEGKVGAIGFPQQMGLAYELWFDRPSPYADHFESHQLFINPYTGEVTGQRLKVDFERGWRGPLMDVVLRLHYSLTWGVVGMNAVGLIGIGLIFSLLSGLILWWPLSGQYWKALTIKRRASTERFNFDLHKTFGFYSAIVLLYLTLSGVYLIFPDYGRELVSVFSPVSEAYPTFQSATPQDGQKSISLAQVATITNMRFPGGDYRWIGFPKDEHGVYHVGKRAEGEVNPRQPYRQLWIDQYNGKVIHAREAAMRSAGDILLEWLYPLHTGEAFGFTGQLIVSFSGLVPLVLYVTGMIRWLQKRGAKRRIRSLGKVN
jgi:uncharacterized iron-regulated membrane protein